MGVHGLTACLKKCAARAVAPTDWDALRGKRVGVDVSCFVHRATAAGVDAVVALALHVAAWRALGVEPVVVFDGRPPAEKAGVLAARRSERLALATAMATDAVSRSDDAVTASTSPQSVPFVLTAAVRDAMKRLLYASGVLFAHALNEADMVLAHLARVGAVDAVASGDMDFLARGVPLLLTPPAAQPLAGATLALPGGCAWRSFRLASVCSGLRLTPDGVRALSVLLGCDYAEGVGMSVSGAGSSLAEPAWRSVLTAVRASQGDLGAAAARLRAVSCLDTDAALTRASTLLEGTDDSLLTTLGCMQLERVSRGPPPHEPDALDALWSTHVLPVATPQLLEHADRVRAALRGGAVVPGPLPNVVLSHAVPTPLYLPPSPASVQCVQLARSLYAPPSRRSTTSVAATPAAEECSGWQVARTRCKARRCAKTRV